MKKGTGAAILLAFAVLLLGGLLYSSQKELADTQRQLNWERVHSGHLVSSTVRWSMGQFDSFMDEAETATRESGYSYWWSISLDIPFAYLGYIAKASKAGYVSRDEANSRADRLAQYVYGRPEPEERLDRMFEPIWEELGAR